MTITGSRRSNRLLANTPNGKPSPRKKTPTPVSKEKSGRGRKPNGANKLNTNNNTPPAAATTGNDEMSVDSQSTNAADNTTEHTFSSFVTFLSFQIGVAKATKGSEEMRNKIMELFKILRQADKTLAFSVYKMDAVIDIESNQYTTNSSSIISTPEDIPTSITMMGKYFNGARPNNKGGTIWTQIRLLHNVEIENIIADTRDDFLEKKGRLTVQSIQHWDVATLGFF